MQNVWFVDHFQKKSAVDISNVYLEATLDMHRSGYSIYCVDC